MTIKLKEGINTLICGLGKVGLGGGLTEGSDVLTHYKAISTSPLFELVGLVDPNIEKRDLLGEKDKSKYYERVEQVQARVDVAIVAVPIADILSATEEILSRFEPKMILVEKPLGFDERLWNGSKSLNSHSRICFVNYSRRADPSFHALREIIARVSKEDDIQVTARYGGSFFNSASHLLDLLRWFLGDLREIKYAVARKDVQKNLESEIDFGLTYDSARVSVASVGKFGYPIFEIDFFTNSGVFRARSPFKGVIFEPSLDRSIEINSLTDEPLFQNYSTVTQLNVAKEILRFLSAGETSLPSLKEALEILKQLREISNIAGFSS